MSIDDLWPVDEGLIRHTYIKLTERKLAPRTYVNLAMCGVRVVRVIEPDATLKGTVAGQLAQGLLPLCEACKAEEAADWLAGFLRIACTRCFGLGVPDKGEPEEREVKHALGKCPTCLGLGFRRANLAEFGPR